MAIEVVVVMAVVIMVLFLVSGFFFGSFGESTIQVGAVQESAKVGASEQAYVSIYLAAVYEQPRRIHMKDTLS